MAGTTPTSSPPSPHWSETATCHSRPCPPARCRYLPSSNQVRDLVSAVRNDTPNRFPFLTKGSNPPEKDCSHITRLCFFSQVEVQHPRRRCSAFEDTVQTIRGRSHLCNSTCITETIVYTNGSTQVRMWYFLMNMQACCPVSSTLRLMFSSPP